MGRSIREELVVTENRKTFVNHVSNVTPKLLSWVLLMGSRAGDVHRAASTHATFCQT